MPQWRCMLEDDSSNPRIFEKAMKSANLVVVVSFIIHLLNNINKK